mmetsp:Transcript_3114/g.8132  ORF Transcript_3114/g.8132 Transcript_3114/m.8132 type:complete len:620 (-) Transcript_3114:2263-4122(-)
MLPPGNLIVSLYFRSFRVRIPLRPHTARAALRQLRRNKRKGITADDVTSMTGGGGRENGGDPPQSGLGLSRAASKWIQEGEEMAAMLNAPAGRSAEGGGRLGGNSAPPPKRESWRANALALKDDEGSDDDENEEFEMYDDIYSMLFLCHLISPASLFALLTFALKIMFFTFLILDLLKDNPEGNPFGAPPGINNLVRISQFLMLPVAVAMQEDLIGSIFLVNVHYDEAVLEVAPGATRFKWIFSSGLRLFDGMYSLVVNFCLLLTSETVLGLMLNFAALAFLQTVDNVAFHLALHGYLTESIEEVAHRTTKVTLPKYARGWWGVMDSVAFVAIFVGVTIVWIIVTVRQIKGEYLCQSLGAEFGPDLFQNAEAFNGAYYKVGGFTIALRAVYTQKREASASGSLKGVFAFCEKRDYWTYTLWDAAEDITTLTEDKVCHYALRSPKVTGNFDITEIPPSDWFYRDRRKAGNDEPAEGYNLFCTSCEDADDCSGKERGTCGNFQCVCNPNFYGMKCEYEYDPLSTGLREGSRANSVDQSTAASQLENLREDFDGDHKQDLHFGGKGDGERRRRQTKDEEEYLAEGIGDVEAEDAEDRNGWTLDSNPSLDLGGTRRALRPRRR